MARRLLTAAIAAVIAMIAILTAMLTGCAPRTPEEEFYDAKERVSSIDTVNFFCLKEFLMNVVLEEAGIKVEDIFIRIADNTMTVHVLSDEKTYTVYTVESKNLWGIVHAISSEENAVYLASHDDEGNSIYITWPFDEYVWTAYHDVEGDRIIFDP